ncbi:PocR ligand-binding domain-containing protein [Rheinheimera sp. UJ63]|uniref:PocR ligand-binding domain-containing protein n=1 Tax=Rheinheimera sp. UJ63 TaxID=2910157 RepID=UPI001F30A01D|nr:PocR ligand-binding domain-containing protein [Rheinheimera sp. UJ63]MCF4007936.1 PocR ligand-binding domain-containing protein [Rheinheimera sp. UJ63]
MGKFKEDIKFDVQNLNPLLASWQFSASSQAPDAQQSVLKTLDLNLLNSIFENFQKALGVSIALIDLHGKVVSSSNWQRVCMQFHRQHPASLKNCISSDTTLANEAIKQQDFATYACLNGLIDCAAPVKILNKHVANLYIGQFFIKKPDLNFFKQQAKALSFDEDSYLKAIAEVPIIPESKIEAMMKLIAFLAEQVAELSHSNYKADRMLQIVEQQVKNRTHELEMQNQILSMISHGSALSDVLIQLVRQIEAQYPEILCSILILDEAQYCLRVAAAPSLPQAFNDAIDGLTPGPDAGSCGSAAYSGQAVMAEDLLQHPHWQAYRELVLLNELRACWSIPIKNAQGKVLGAFGFYQKEPGLPSAEFSSKMAIFSNLAELAISRSLSAAHIHKMAFYDHLTGLANRRLLDDRLQLAFKQSKRSNSFGALLFIDLNNFKPVNDRFGHKVGDLLLIEVANRLTNQVREVDTVARLGGDEFVIVLCDLDCDADKAKTLAQQLAEKISAALAEPHVFTETLAVQHSCTGSIGANLFHGAQHNSSDVLRQADIAMYQAKQQAKAICWFESR